MSKRDLLRKANAGNVQNRGTEAVLNEEPAPKAKPAAPKETIRESKTTVSVPKETKTPEKTIEKPVKTVVSSKSSASSKISKSPISENLAKYTGAKISKSIMLSAEDNKYLIKQAAAKKKPIQDIFGEIMADEIEEVKKGNIDEELAESFLKLRANNERRNVLIPEDLSLAISDTASDIPLKQGKFILYALARKRNAQ